MDESYGSKRRNIAWNMMRCSDKSKPWSEWVLGWIQRPFWWLPQESTLQTRSCAQPHFRQNPTVKWYLLLKQLFKVRSNFFTTNTKQSSIVYITHYSESSWFNISLKTWIPCIKLCWNFKLLKEDCPKFVGAKPITQNSITAKSCETHYPMQNPLLKY